MAGLPTRRLGRSGPEITTVGLGAWAIGGGSDSGPWGPQDDEDSAATIRRAVELGINWIDTAAAYGDGHSEEIVGKAVRTIPEADRPLLFTKAGVLPGPDGSRRRVGDPDSLRGELENSLRRLQVDQIDLYQMHWPPDDGTALEDYWQVFVDARDAGKVRWIGISNHTVEQLTLAESIGHVDSVQPGFSAIRTEYAESGLFPWCVSNGTGVIVYSPMGAGLLTGAFTAARVAALPADDWRRGHEQFNANLEHNLGIADRMAQVARRHGVSTAAIAIAWTLGFEGVTGAIVGARRPEQIDGWIAGAGVTLTADDYDLIGSAQPPAR